MPVTLSQELRYRLISYLADHPAASQREIARDLGLSLGKVNYCLRALIDKGWLKARNFKNSRDKSAYMYALTRRGVEQRVRLTYEFLQIKVAEHDAILLEIERLRGEAERFRAAAEKEGR